MFMIERALKQKKMAEIENERRRAHHDRIGSQIGMAAGLQLTNL